MKKDSLKSVIVLVAICLVIAVAMAAVNMVTEDRIADAEALKATNAMKNVMGEGTFERIELSELPTSVTEVYSFNGGEGYVVMLDAKGYDSSKPMKIAIGLTAEGTVTNCEIISCTGETAGIGTKVQSDASFLASFAGKDASLEGVDTISGATVSSKGVIKAVQEAFVAFEMAKEAAK